MDFEKDSRKEKRIMGLGRARNSQTKISEKHKMKDMSERETFQKFQNKLYAKEIHS